MAHAINSLHKAIGQQNRYNHNKNRKVALKFHTIPVSQKNFGNQALKVDSNFNVGEQSMTMKGLQEILKSELTLPLFLIIQIRTDMQKAAVTGGLGFNGTSVTALSYKTPAKWGALP